MSIGVQIIGERRIALRFEEFPEFARSKLKDAITKLQAKLMSAVSDRVPKGPSGKLAASVAGGVEDSPNKVRGWVNVAGRDRALILQAVALEYGSHKTIKVAEKAGRGLSTVYGHYISPIQVLVGAYTRTTDIAAQRFLRGPLADLSTEAMGAMTNALQEATEQA